MFEIIITVDQNDGDYNTQISKISQEELNKIKPLIQSIKDFKPYTSFSKSGMIWTHDHNYPFGEYVPHEDLGEKHPEEIYPQFDNEIHQMFRDLCPFGEHGFHSIVSVEVQPFVQKERLL